MDDPFYDWLYSGVYLPTPMASTDIHSQVTDAIIPQSTFGEYLGFEPKTARLTVESSTAELILNLKRISTTISAQARAFNELGTGSRYFGSFIGGVSLY